MILRRWPAFLSLLGLTFFPATFPLIAQHPPLEHVPEMPSHDQEGRAPENPNEQGIEAPKLDGHIHMPVAELEAAIMRRRSGGSAPLTTLRWEKTQDAAGKPSWSATAQTGKPANMDFNALEESLKHGNVFVNEGTLPRGKEWRDLNALYPDQMIFHEPESANRDPEAIRAAIRLADRPLNLANIKVFDALPYETELEGHFQEQNRMGIGGTMEHWRNLHQEIQGKLKQAQPHRATREALLEELHNGTSDVMILYAHFDGEQLYMPGAHGGTIRVDELAGDRKGVPGGRHRIVILVACNTGARTPENPRSLTSVLLEKGLAGTVIATDHPYDSREIPALLARLANGVPLRKAVGMHDIQANPAQRASFLQQFVRLQPPIPWPPFCNQFENGID